MFEGRKGCLTKMEIVKQLLRLILLITYGAHVVRSKREINIIGFFPMSDDIPEGKIGRGVRPAVDLAVEMVNGNSTLLKDYQLKMYFNDSKCDMAVATKLLFDTLHDRHDNAMLFGDACIEVTGPMAQISQWWNMSQLSYADTNPILSDRSKYPRLFRVVPSDSDFNTARLALLRHFKWKRVGTIFQDASKGSSRYGYAHNRMVDLLENSSILVTRTESFADDPGSAVQNLLDRDVRIILGNFAPDMARRVFCQAYKRGMFGDKYQWIILGGYPDDWWKKADKSISCTVQELKRAMHGYIATDILPLSSSNSQTAAKMTSKEYQIEYNNRRENEYSKFHGYAFDGVWVIAMALDRLLQQAEPSASDWEDLFRTTDMVDALDETSFQGVTGGVKFQNGDRIGHIELQQFQDGRIVKVGEFQKDGDILSLEEENKLIWTGKGPPRDRYLQSCEMQRVHTPIYAALCVLAGLGIFMALVFLTTNVYFRKHRYIKMSSPNMNNIIIVGCIMNYVSVFLLGTDGGLLPPDRFPLMCSARAWVLAIGFTLAFGAMFSKTWRVHAIFTNIKLNKKVIKDYKLFFIVCVLLLLDAVILALWQGIDPLQRSQKRLASEIVGDVEIIPLIEYCHSKHMTAWMATLYVYKGLLLVFGCFLAWETRQVSIPALNDSKYIGMSVYNVVIMCTCGAAVSFVIKDQPNAAFIIIGLFIIFCTTITLCLVFVPKIVELQRDPEGEDKRVRATLKKPSKRDKNSSSDLHEKVKLLSAENIRYKDILEEKNKQIRELLRELGEDVNSFDYTIKSPVHKSVLSLRQKGYPDMSPTKVSRSSVGTEDDNGSCYSDSSLTQLYIDSPEHHRHSSYLHSRNSNSITESIELTDIGRKTTTGKLSPIRDSREYIEVDSYDPYSGVYLGPSEPEVTVIENVNYRPPATEEHPIVQRYSGVSFLDDQPGQTGNLSEESDHDDSDQDLSNHCSVHSGGSLPDVAYELGFLSAAVKNKICVEKRGKSPEEKGLLEDGNKGKESDVMSDIDNGSETDDSDVNALDQGDNVICETDHEEIMREADLNKEDFHISVINETNIEENTICVSEEHKSRLDTDHSCDDEVTGADKDYPNGAKPVIETSEDMTIDGKYTNEENEDNEQLKVTFADYNNTKVGDGDMIDQEVDTGRTIDENTTETADAADTTNVDTVVTHDINFTSRDIIPTVQGTIHDVCGSTDLGPDFDDSCTNTDELTLMTDELHGSPQRGMVPVLSERNPEEQKTSLPPGAVANFDEGKEIFITESLQGPVESKIGKPSRSTGDNPIFRPLLSTMKHRKVAPKSKDKKTEVDKSSRTLMCDVVEYI